MTKASAGQCTLCRVRPSGLSCGLRGRALERLQRDVVVHVFKRGQIIFYAGATAQALYVIRSGRVKIYRSWHDGEEQVLRLLGPGEIIGYRPLLAGEPCGATAEAVAESAVCVIPAATLREVIRDLPELALELLAKLARELRVSEELMMDLIRRPVPQRAARLLLTLLADNQGAPDPSTIPSHQLRRKDMARMIGTTPETFSRVLRALAQRRIVSLARGHIRVRDHALLRAAAGEDGSARLDGGQVRT